MAAAYLYDAVRTPRGKAKPEGGLAALSPQELVKQQAAALAERCGDGARNPDALFLGCVGQVADQGGHIALVSKLHAGLPDNMAAISLNNYCTSGLTAIGQAAAMVASGQSDTVLAGGVECMSRVPFMGDKANYYSDPSLSLRARYIPVVLAADRLANAEGISRDELDAAALASQQKAVAAEQNPTLQRSRIATGGLAVEECIRPKTDAAFLAAIAPGFGALQDQYAEALGGARFVPLHTIAHAPPVCDGAALALVGSQDRDSAPRARILSFAECGGDPAASLTAGFAAMDRALEKAGLTLGDMDRIEFMEAFGVTIAKFLRDRDVDPSRVNVGGGHIAKGHPLGASGAILTSSLLDSLDAADGTLGLVVMSGAAGVGTAMIVERMN
ncbi:acetyl-CoA C-acyltransferase [Parasphingopyxis lamellibrachiae]|uniref:Acetyl-CoA C-acetyltransferase/acetyl-CoA acyltransferase n=1 Tax=Parasphingopyxis lamellibrachiae TaxID=680125 RepID=A0A3D9FJ14_9SPHN|nr:acetyl-CoA C-acyltransferase [Parasphingopyxis lamellibrachiae]RED17794.1 acetyl-CoA C-acetyltransferase/acetyl-CoA acyltransferase [Parasphingopyxis lamellibrachiae]